MNHMWLAVGAAALGGAAGSVLRYLISSEMAVMLGTSFPYGTLAVNAAGALCIGFFGVLISGISKNPLLGLFVITGILGGLTTFSSLVNEVIQYLSAGQFWTGFGYLFLQVFLGLFLAAVGGFSARWIFF